MMRCPRCGLRVAESSLVCAKHGALEHPSQSLPSPVMAVPDLQPSAAFDALGYRVGRVLGRGGFGVVFSAERRADGARVAIKLAPSERRDAVESLRSETAAMRAIGAPYVPEIYDSGAIEGAEYLAMERIDAPTLAERLVSLAGPAPLDVFGVISHALLAPLEAIHRAGMVHRDLKPENIFVDDSGMARIIDFGLARQKSVAIEEIERTSAGDDIGTAEYMSPEQCDGLLEADPRSDIYSLGTLFYELLSGSPPFWGRAADVREAHRSRRPTPLALVVATCPRDLDQVVRRCLAKDRRQRYADVAAVREALLSSLNARVSLRPMAPRPGGPTISRPAGPPPSAAREKRAMGLVFFESRAGLGAVQPVVTASGGQIVQTSGAQYVAAIGHDVDDNPARVAIVAAYRLLAAKLSQRLLVDVATVSVQNRPDGSRRIFSALLTKADRFPSADDPPGVMFTGAASEVLIDLGTRPLEGRSDRFVLAFERQATELTTLGIQLSPLIGRQEVLSSLTDSAKLTAEQARPALTTVFGAHGYGRTHLASFVARDLEHSAHGFEVIRLTAQSSVMGGAQVLPELLRRALDLPSEPPAGDPRALLMEKLGDSGSAVAAAHALGWLGADHPELRRLAAAPGALRFAMARAAGEALRRRAAHKPVAILLDDAHLADEAALDALEYATLRDVSVKIWACVLARPTFAGSRPSWGSRAAATLQITLRELETEYALELARRLLLPAEYVPEAVLRRLHERTQGVPRLLVELVRGLKRDGFIRRSERGTGYYVVTDALDKLPDLPIVQWNAIREVEALPSQLAGHARLASVLGANFSISEVEALLSMLEREQLPEDMQLDASVGVQRLVDTGILVRHRNGLIDFRHALLRDTIYQSLPEPQRARLHRAAFEAYRSLALPEEVRLPRLALHAAHCGERHVAAEANLELARRYTRIQAYLEAEAAYGRALDNLAGDDERSIAAARGRGLMRSRLGRQEEAVNDLRNARERANAFGATERVIELMLDEATVLDWMREASQASVVVDAVANMDFALTPLLRARLAMGLARGHHRRGEAEASIRVGGEAVQLAAALGDEGYETRIVAQLMVATDCAMSGRLEEAEGSFEQVIVEAGSRGDLFHLAAAYSNRAVLWHGRRNLERLFADLACTVRLAREVGEASIEYVAVINLAESEYLLGKTSAARAGAQRGFELSKQLFGDSNREVSVSELLLGRIALYDDDLAAARQYTLNIRQRIDRGLLTGERDTELEPGLGLLLDMVELGASEAPQAEWRALLERSQKLELQPMEEVELLECAAISAAKRGELDEARALYQQTLEVSQRKPNLLSERVPHKLGVLLEPRA